MVDVASQSRVDNILVAQPCVYARKEGKSVKDFDVVFIASPVGEGLKLNHKMQKRPECGNARPNPFSFLSMYYRYEYGLCPLIPLMG
jgi:hypothetical protein